MTIATLTDIDIALEITTNPKLRKRLLRAREDWLKSELEHARKKQMTSPYERTRSLLLTKQFLQRLSQTFAHVLPAEVMLEANWLLEHYPTLQDVETAHKASPDLFGPVPLFQRHVVNLDFLGILDAVAQAGERK
jgi:hypothetical protein